MRHKAKRAIYICLPLLGIATGVALFKFTEDSALEIPILVGALILLPISIYYWVKAHADRKRQKELDTKEPGHQETGDA